MEQVIGIQVPTQGQAHPPGHGGRFDSAFDDEFAQSQWVEHAHVILEVVGHPPLAGAIQPVVWTGVPPARPLQAVAAPVRDGLQVTGTPVGGGIVGSHVHEGPWVVHGQLQPFNVDGHFLRLRPQPFGGSSHSVGQQVPQTLAPGDLFHQGDDSFLVAPRQIESAGLIGAEQALFVGFHGQGDGRADGDGVQAVAVAQFIGFGDHGHVRVQKHGSERAQGFVLRGVAGHAGVRSLPDLDVLSAADGTGETVGVFWGIDLEHVLAGGGLCPIGPTAQQPVFDGQIAGGFGGRYAARRAQQRHADGFIAYVGVVGFDLSPQTGFVRVFRPLRSTDGDGFQVFGGHRRAHPAAPARAL